MSDLVKTQIVGFLMHRLNDDYLGRKPASETLLQSSTFLPLYDSPQNQTFSNIDPNSTGIAAHLASQISFLGYIKRRADKRKLPVATE